MRSVEVRALNRGPGPESLRVHLADIPEPPPGHVRVRVEAAGVSYGDLLFQRGVVPGGPKPPFTPGCDVTGIVDSVGSGVKGLRPGERVCALVASGGYSAVINVPADRLVAVPGGLTAFQAAGVALNYFIAHQMLHRVARVRSGGRILVHGASGGVGVALLQLTRLTGNVHVWGTCSAANAGVVRDNGADPIDYRESDFVRVVRAAGGRLDAAFDHIGGIHFLRSYRLLRRGGKLVGYGQNAALRDDGRPDMRVGAVGFLGGIAAPKLFPDGRTTAFYNAWSLEKKQPAAYREDLSAVLGLASAGEIAPRSTIVLPLEDADEAFRMLEKGAQGKIVLDCNG